MNPTSIVCDVCGKPCKNERGLNIHRGHMHNGKKNQLIREDFIHNSKDDDLITRDDVLSELHSLRQLIIGLTHSLHQLKNDAFLKYESHLESPSKSPSRLSSLLDGSSVGPPLGMNYGSDHGALMDELRSVLKERALVCA